MKNINRMKKKLKRKNINLGLFFSDRLDDYFCIAFLNAFYMTIASVLLQ